MKYALRDSMFGVLPMCGSSSFCRSSRAYWIRTSRVAPMVGPRLAKKSNANSCVLIGDASSIEFLHAFSIAKSLKSKTIRSRMSLSAMIPSPRSMTTRGTSTRKYGHVQTSWPRQYDLPPMSLRNFTAKPEFPAAPSNNAERISHIQEYLDGCFLANAYTKLLAMRSRAIKTFSEPLMTKYPPWSSGHSPNSVSKRSFAPFSQQYSVLTMIGIFIRYTCLYTSSEINVRLSSSLIMYTSWVMFTKTGAPYVRFRKRASRGVSILAVPSGSSCVGLLKCSCPNFHRKTFLVSTLSSGLYWLWGESSIGSCASTTFWISYIMNWSNDPSC
mmetsp:Transcript_149035/g.415354  ORF Transcript_149035/g.415354 Transcript_149035/m.415354 type:complete len:328 (+) Transcript_149035:2443-3426(+)